MRPIIFITGVGTGVGKTIISAIVTEALKADYCKPIQAGIEDITDAELVRSLITNNQTIVHPEAFRLKLPASPHIAAREEGLQIKTGDIVSHLSALPAENNKPLIVEGAGGLLVPINENETILDLILALDALTIIVSRNYLGSINHSLLTARELLRNNIKVAGWIFNDHFMNYENEIAEWSSIPKLGSIPMSQNPDKQFVKEQADHLRSELEKIY
jgi:dethiobiotin synthetase